MIQLDDESIRLLQQMLCRSSKPAKNKPSKGPAVSHPEPDSKVTAHREAVSWLRTRGADPRNYVIKVNPKPTADAPRTVQIIVNDYGKYWRVLTLETADSGMIGVGSQVDKIYACVGLVARLALAPLMEGP